MRRLATGMEFLAFTLGLGLVWAGFTALIGERFLPGPIGTLGQIEVIVQSSSFARHLGATALAFGYAFGLACLSGLVFGVLLGVSADVRSALQPVFFGLMSIPKVTLYPIILLLFGLGLGAKICFGFLHGLPIIVLAVMGVVRNVRPIYVRVGRSLRLSQGAMIWRILLPFAAPEILSSIRIALSITLQGVILGELFASKEGLGHLLMNAIGVADARTAMALTLLLSIIAVGANLGVLQAGRRFKRGVTT